MKNSISIVVIAITVLISSCNHEESKPIVIQKEFEQFANKYGLSIQKPILLFTIDGNDCNVCAVVAENYYQKFRELHYNLQALALINGRVEIVESYREQKYSIPVAHDSNFNAMKSIGVKVFPSLSICDPYGKVISTFSVDDMQRSGTFNRVRHLVDSMIIEFAVSFPQGPDTIIPLQTSKTDYIASIFSRDKLFFDSQKNTFFVPDDSRNKIYEIDLHGKFVKTIDLENYRSIRIVKPVFVLQQQDTLFVLAKVETKDKSVLKAIMKSEDEHHNHESLRELLSSKGDAVIPMPYILAITKKSFDSIRAFDLSKRNEIHTLTYNTQRNTFIGGVIYVDYGSKDIVPLSKYPSVRELSSIRNSPPSYISSYDSSYIFKSVPYFESPTFVYFSPTLKTITMFDRCSEWLRVYDASYNLLSKKKIYPPADYIKWNNLRNYDRKEMMSSGDIADEYYKYFTPVAFQVQNDGSTIIVYEKARGKLAIIVQKYDNLGNLVIEQSLATSGDSRFIEFDTTNTAWFLNLNNNTIEKFHIHEKMGH